MFSFLLQSITSAVSFSFFFFIVIILYSYFIFVIVSVMWLRQFKIYPIGIQEMERIL